MKQGKYSNDNPFHNYEAASFAESYQQVLKLIHLSSNPNILDLASGKGDEAQALRGMFGGTVYELDINDEPGKLSNNQRLKVLANLEQLPFAGESFDFLHIKDSIVHIPNLDKFFSESVRILKPGGQLLVVVEILGDDEQKNDPYFIVYKNNNNVTQPEVVRFGSNDDYNEAVSKYLEAKQNAEEILEISPPYFHRHSREIVGEASTAGLSFSFLFNSPDTWTPEANEKNWGHYQRKIFLFKK